jgi:hypothetical protein
MENKNKKNMDSNTSQSKEPNCLYYHRIFASHLLLVNKNFEPWHNVYANLSMAINQVSKHVNSRLNFREVTV